MNTMSEKYSLHHLVNFNKLGQCILLMAQKVYYKNRMIYQMHISGFFQGGKKVSKIPKHFYIKYPLCGYFPILSLESNCYIN